MSTDIYNDDKFLQLTEKILQEKTMGNEKFKNQQNSEAESYYKNAIESSEDFFKNIPKTEKENLKENSFYQKFLNELKNSYSNLAAVYLRMGKNKEIIEVDKFILSEIDSNFDKSYARMITAYQKLDEKDNAIDLYILMLKRFNKETMQKYEEQLKDIEIASKKKLEHYKQMYEKSKKQNSNSGSDGTSFFTSWKFKVLQAVIIGLIYFVYFFYFKGGLNNNNNNNSVNVNITNNTNNLSDKLNKENSKSNSNLDLDLDLDNLKEEDLALNAMPEKNEKKIINDKDNNDDYGDYKYDNDNEEKEKEKEKEKEREDI
jgi:hypothetical protein